MADQRSPFVHDMPDPNDRERYVIHVREVYVAMKELASEARRHHVDYGRWIMVSLLSLHAGSIYVLGSMRPDEIPLKILAGAAAWNVAGIVFTLLAGMFAWLNFQVAEHLYKRWTNPAMLYRTDAWPTDEQQRDPITATLFAASACGLLSLWCLIASATNMLTNIGT